MVLRVSSKLLQGGCKTCAGCRQPFVRRRGWSEAIVGADSRLYCYGTSCERNARTASATRRTATRSAA
jgi:hypothetical protein